MASYPALRTHDDSHLSSIKLQPIQPQVQSFMLCETSLLCQFQSFPCQVSPNPAMCDIFGVSYWFLVFRIRGLQIVCSDVPYKDSSWPQRLFCTALFYTPMILPILPSACMANHHQINNTEDTHFAQWALTHMTSTWKPSGMYTMSADRGSRLSMISILYETHKNSRKGKYFTCIYILGLW